MENLTSLPGDITTPIDPNKEEFILPVTNENLETEVDLPIKDSPLINAYRDSLEADPDHIAKVQAIAKKLNENPFFIEKNLSSAEKFINSPDSTYWNEYEKRYPNSAKFLSEQKNMAIAHDDHENIGKSEAIIERASFAKQLFEDVTYSGLSQMYSGFLRIPGMAYNVAAFPQNLIAKSLGAQQVSSDDFKDINPFEKAAQYYDKSAKSAPSQNDNLDFLGLAEKGDISGASKALLRTVAQNAPQQLFNIMLGLSGAGVATTFATAGASSAASAFNESGKSGVDVVGRTLDATAQGMFEGTMEQMGTVSFIKEAEKALTKRVGKDTALAIIKDMGKTAGASFVTEFSEETATQLGQDFSKYATGVDPSVKDSWFKNALGAGMVGGVSGGLMSSPSVSLTARARAVQKLQADSFKKNYVELVNNESESKLKERSPDAYEMLKKQQVQGTAIENIVVSAEALNTFYQSKNINPEKIYSELGIADKINEAIEAGAKVEIPTEKWLARVSKEDQIALADDVSHSHEAPTVNENKNFDSQITEQLTAADKLALEKAQTDEKIKGEAEAVRSNVYEQLINIGQEKQTAEANAELFKRVAVVAAAKQGMSPSEWFQKQNLEIRGDNFVEKYVRKTIPKFESQNILDEDQVKKALKDLNLPESYQGEESISAIRSTIAFLNDEIQQAEAGKKIFLEQEDSSDLKVIGQKSTFPEWVKGLVGARPDTVSKEDFTKIATKGNSKYTKNLVAKAIEVLKSGHGEDPRFGVAPNLDFVSLVEPESLSKSQAIHDEMNTAREAAQAKEYDQAAYHGSPHKFDEFKLNAIGSGEGAQAYGWGLYFASDKKIAEWYRSKLSKERYEINGIDKNFTDNLRNWSVQRDALEKYTRGEWTRTELSKAIGESVARREKAITEKEQILKEDKNIDSSYEWILKENIKSDKETIDLLNKIEAQSDPKLKIESGQLYQVDVPESEQMLDWDNPITEQENLINTILHHRNDDTEGSNLLNQILDDADGNYTIQKQADGAYYVLDASGRPTHQIAYWSEAAAKEYIKELKSEKITGELLYEKLAYGLGASPEAASRYLNSIGIHGLKYLDADSRGSSKGTHNFVIFDDSKVKIEKTFYQSADTKRGSIQFQQEKTVITLLNSSDKSTFLHEMGHLFFEDFYNHAMSGDASVKHMKDWQVLAEHVGYDAEQTSLTVDQHEKLARTFEAYLMDGKAPVKGLEKVFRVFRRWLSNIYVSMKSLGVEISPEVRDVMDRMVATEDEIAIAKKKSGLDYNIDMSDMPDNVKEKMLNLEAEADEKAFSRLMKDQMKEISKENQDFLKEKEKELRARIKEEVRNSDEGIFIEDVQGEIQKKDIWNEAEKYINGTLSEERQLQFDIAAENLHYTSGDHMAQYIKSLSTIDEMTNAKVAEEMKQFFAMTEPEMVRAKAMQVIHSEKSVELLALQKEILFEKANEAKTKELNKVADAMENGQLEIIQSFIVEKFANDLLTKQAKKFDKKSAQFQKEIARLEERANAYREKTKQKELAAKWLEAKDEAEQRKLAADFRESVASLKKELARNSSDEADRVKEIAREMLSKKPYKEARKFTQYFTAERNAALRVAKAVQNNDWQGALKAKHEQMINHALAKEAIRISKRSESQLRYLDNMQKLKKTLWKHEDHYFQAANILERFGFGRSDYDATLKTEQLGEWADRQVELGYSVNIADWLYDENIRLDHSTMTTEQLEDIKNAVKNIREIANMENRSFAMDQARTLDQIEAELIASSADNVEQADRIELKIYPTLVDKYSDKVSKYFNSLKTIETILLRFDGYKENGPWQKYFLRSVHAAADTESVKVHEMQNKLDKLYTGHYSKKELRDFKNKKVFSQALNRSVTLETLISMGLNMGNAINREKLFNTPGVGFDSNNWGKASIEAALREHLSEKDWKFIQESWDLIDSYWGEISAMETKLAGFAPIKIKAEPFTVYTKDGKGIEMKGGYYPLKADTRASFEAERLVEIDKPLSKLSAPPKRASTNTGHTKARTKAQYALRLDTGVMTEHLYNVIHDLSFRPTIIDINRVLGRASIQNDVRSVEGANGFALLKQWAVAVGGQDPDHVPAGDAITSAMKSIRTSTTKYMLAVNIKNVIQNLANISLYGGQVDGFGHVDAFKAVLKSIPAQLQILKGERPLHSFVEEKSSFMRDRSQNPEFSLREMADKHFDGHSHLAQVAQHLMAFTDNMTAEPVWTEAYLKKINEGASEKDAVFFADTIVKRAIGSGRRYDQASVYRSGEAVKIFTMFTSFMNTQYNNWSRETGRQLNKPDLVRAMTFLGSQFIFVIASGILTAKIKMGDDDEEMNMAQDSIRELTSYGMGFFPVLRDVGPMITDRLIWDKPGTYRASPAFEIFNSTIKATNAIGSGSMSGKRKVEEIAKVPLLLTGTPKQFSDWFWNAYDVADGMEPKAMDLMKRRPVRER